MAPQFPRTMRSLVNLLSILGFLSLTCPAWAVIVNGEDLDGTITVVTDATAEGGQCVSVSGNCHTASTVAPGGYTYTVRVKGTSVRAKLTLDGQRVGEFAVSDTWQEIAVPVYIPLSTSAMGIEPVAPNGGGAIGTLYVDWIKWDSASVGHTTRGNKIIDPDGSVFFPRGMKIGGIVDGRSDQVTFDNAKMRGSYMNQHPDESVRWLKNWGATAVVLSLNENFWLGGCSSVVSQSLLQDYVDAWVRKLTDGGIYVIIQVHVRGDYANDPCQYDKTGGLGFRVAYDTLWPSIAARYKDNPLVGFELNNEPPGAPDGWQSDVTSAIFRDGNSKYSGQKELVHAIRDVGAQNLIFIPAWGMGYSDMGVFVNQWVDGYGIVYSVHHYGDHTDADRSARYAVLYGWPVAVTEFGSLAGNSDPSLALPSYRTALIDFAEANLAGWPGAFAWLNWWDAKSGLVTDTATYNPTAQGQPVRDGLWDAKGWSNWGGLASSYASVPSAVTDLSAAVSGASDVQLTWTAPNENGGTPGGQASFYEVRYSRVPITATTWKYPTTKSLLDGILVLDPPKSAGFSESFILPSLNISGQRRYFNVWTGAKLSAIANLATISVVSNHGILNSSLSVTWIHYNDTELGGIPANQQGQPETVPGETDDGTFSSVLKNEYLRNVAAVDSGTGYKIRVRAKGTNSKIVVKYNGTKYQAWANATLKDTLLSTNYGIYETTAASGFSGVNVVPENLVQISFTEVNAALPANMSIDWVEVTK